MRITLHTANASYPLAGEFQVSERLVSGAVDFVISAAHISDRQERIRAVNANFYHRGNLATTVSFSTRRVLASHAEAVIYGADLNSQTARSGEVMFTTGAGARHLLDAVVGPPAVTIDGGTVLVSYTATGTSIERRLPLILISSGSGAGLTLSPGGGGTFPDEAADAQVEGTLYRIVDDGQQKWFEAGFLAPSNTLIGSASAGWQDAGKRLIMRFQRSENLIDWDHDIVESPGSPVAAGNGYYNYWVRSKYPADSAIKSGSIQISSTTQYDNAGAFIGDPRNNPITGVTIAGVVQNLLGVTYTMPGDAAALQARLLALGWAGTTVVASSNVMWEIIIPGVQQTSYSQRSQVSWPQYLVEDMLGQLTIPVNGAAFAGVFINAAGVRTSLAKQFFRCQFLRGENHQF